MALTRPSRATGNSVRLLHIIDTLNPESGGPSEGVRLLLSFQEPGFSAEVVTLDPPDAPYLRNSPFPIHALGPRRSGGTYAFAPELYRWLRKHRDNYDGFVVNGLWQFCGLAALWAIGRHKPYVVFTHGMLDPWFRKQYPWKHLKKLPYWYLVEFWVLHTAFRVLFTSTTEASLAQRSFALHRWHPAIVPYGVNRPSGDPETEARAFLQSCPAVVNRRFLLFLGRIQIKKGCDLLLRSFAAQAARDPELHLVMAGPDPEGWVAQLQQLATDLGCAHRVHWPGMLRGEAKWGAFRLAEAFILPSHQENFGIAVAESLACGTPVLISDQVNIAQEIEFDGCGYVAHDTLDGTISLIDRWLATSPLSRQRMQAQALSTFRLRYDIEQNARKLVRLFAPEPVIPGRRRSDRIASNPGL